jgi:hypothetical protein
MKTIDNTIAKEMQFWYLDNYKAVSKFRPYCVILYYLSHKYDILEKDVPKYLK